MKFSAVKSLAVALFAAGVLVLLLAVALGGSPGAEAHAGHPEKKLFNERWHYEPNGDYDAWMTLTIGVSYECGASAEDCESRWDNAVIDGIADWNGQPTTVRFTLRGDSPDNDVRILISDTIDGQDGTTLGFAPTYDQAGQECGDGCSVYSGVVFISDAAHADEYATADSKLATVTHEIGHIIGLAHESEDLPCGQDAVQGEIPASIMAYNCSDPVSLGGQGMPQVQPWDACGINHAYFDPGIGYAGCVGGPEGAVQGDANCDNIANSLDALGTLQFTANAATPACIDNADVNCDGSKDSVDALGILLYTALLPGLSKPAECVDIGDALG